jgi:Alcohol dehydrogenase GroES-like domain
MRNRLADSPAPGLPDDDDRDGVAERGAGRVAVTAQDRVQVPFGTRLRSSLSANCKGMRAMLLEAPGSPLRPAELPRPVNGRGQVRLRVLACGVCRTDLHIIDGGLRHPKLPLVLGHQIVGLVEAVGAGVTTFELGERVGVPWLGWTCGECVFCRSGRENLCEQARFTGYDIDGGFAEETVADARFCFRIPSGYADLQAAPLLCAGLIGYRSLRMAGDAQRLGLYGFGAAAHIICPVGSSRNSTCGECISPRAISKLRFTPPENVRTRLRRRSDSSTISRTSSNRRPICERGTRYSCA